MALESRSTEDALSDLITKMYGAVDAAEPAFDTVSHTEILDILESIGA